MICLGTIINFGAVLVGGMIGRLFGRFIPERFRTSLQTACGVSTLFIGIAGAMEGMLTVEQTEDVLSIGSHNALVVVLCIALGALVGELCNIEHLFEKFASFLKVKFGGKDDEGFVDAFLTATYTVCIGAMTIIGAIEDGVNHDITIYVTKSILDFVIVMMLSCSKGKGAIFSCIPILIIQGGLTLLASLIAPLFTAEVLFNISLIGSILIFCVGINLLFEKKVKVANLLPALIFAVLATLIF